MISGGMGDGGGGEGSDKIMIYTDSIYFKD